MVRNSRDYRIPNRIIKMEVVMTNREFFKYILLFYLPVYSIVLLANFTEINWLILIGILFIMTLFFYSLKNKGLVKEPYNPTSLRLGLIVIYVVVANFTDINKFLAITVLLLVMLMVDYYNNVVLKIENKNHMDRL